jgi:hypothetical protein
MSKKIISSVVVTEDIDDWKECAALHGASRSVEAVLSSGLLTICSFESSLFGLSGSGLAMKNRSCMGDNRAGELAVRLSG